MGICHDRRFAEYISHDQIGTLSSDSGKLLQSIKIPGNIVMILFVEDFHTGTDISCLTLTQTTWTYDCFDICNICICKSFYSRELCIQILYNYIYSCICTLCSQTHTYQSFPCIIIIQSAVCIRIFLFNRSMTSRASSCFVISVLSPILLIFLYLFFLSI